jgi:hypothetical protein
MIFREFVDHHPHGQSNPNTPDIHRMTIPCGIDRYGQRVTDPEDPGMAAGCKRCFPAVRFQLLD